jgi:hypothetical protein
MKIALTLVALALTIGPTMAADPLPLIFDTDIGNDVDDRYSPPPHERPCWDLTSVLYAVYPDRGYFGHSATGRVTVEDNGVTRFTAASSGAHRFLTVSKEQAIRCREAFANLASQPPSEQVK